MIDTLILSGASLNSRAWARSITDALMESGIKATLFEYKHWKVGGELDIENESKSVRAFLAENQNITNIIAKSAGSIVAMQAEKDNTTIGKNIFIGIPIEYAKDHNIDLESLVHNHHTTTLCIQAKGDPMASYKEVLRLIERNKKMKAACIDGDDHQYPDLELLVTRIKEYFPE